MISLLSADICTMDESVFTLTLDLLPNIMRQEVMKYKFINDKKLGLLARCLLINCLNEVGKMDLLEKWQRDKYNKPFIPGWNEFNISHSGKLVVICYAAEPIGIDIEKISPLSIDSLLHNFHPDEQEYVLTSSDKEKSFYKLWTRKEAFLKAVGLGLGIELSAINCIQESVRYRNKTWYFYEIFVHKFYYCHICYSKKENIIHSKIFQEDLFSK